MDLIHSLIEEGWLETPEIINAFKKIKRRDFMPEGQEHLAKINEALPISSGQTISQPMVVAFMIEQLQPDLGHNILDIGSGSGWTTSILSQIVGLEGKVTAIELIPELREFGESNAFKYSFIEKGIATFICADGSKGYQEEAPFDRILVSAALKGKIPLAWRKQLKIGGRIVVPIKSSIWVLEKESEKKFKEKEHTGFAFVPFIQK